MNTDEMRAHGIVDERRNTGELARNMLENCFNPQGCFAVGGVAGRNWLERVTIVATTEPSLIFPQSCVA